MSHPKPRTSHGRRLLDLLSDGQWHRQLDLVEDAIDAVHPGQAHRKAERMRDVAAARQQYQRKGLSGPREIDTVTRGARFLLVSSLHGWHRHGSLEGRGEGRSREWRLPPEPPERA